MDKHRNTYRRSLLAVALILLLGGAEQLDGGGSPRFVQRGSHGRIHLHAQHSVVDWFAFGVWRSGELIRSLSVSPDFGVMEDVGERMPFEVPFWDGAHPAVDEEEEEEYGLPFHPLELSEVALPELFGFVLEGMPLEDSIEPDEVSLLRYAKRPWWKFW